MEYKHPYKTLSIGIFVTIFFVLIVELLTLYGLGLNQTLGMIFFILLSILAINFVFVKQLVKIPPGSAGVLSALGRIKKEEFLDEGWHWVIPFYEKLEQIVSKKVEYDSFVISNLYSNNSIRFTVDVAVHYKQIDPSKLFYTNTDERKKMIEAEIVNGLRSEISIKKLDDYMINSFINPIQGAMLMKLNSFCSHTYGINVSRVVLKYDPDTTRQKFITTVENVAYLMKRNNLTAQAALEQYALQQGLIRQNVNVFSIPQAVDIINAAAQLFNRTITIKGKQP
jgi:hypothetical protein